MIQTNVSDTASISARKHHSANLLIQTAVDANLNALFFPGANGRQDIRKDSAYKEEVNLL